MPELRGGGTVLVVDKDIAFAWWLGEVFGDAGCYVVPALNCRQALQMVKRLRMKVDIVAGNPGLPGFSKMIRSLSGSRRPVKIIAIVNEGDDAAVTAQGDATLERPSGTSVISRQEWVRRVQEILRELEMRGTS